VPSNRCLFFASMSSTAVELHSTGLLVCGYTTRWRPRSGRKIFGHPACMPEPQSGRNGTFVPVTGFMCCRRSCRPCKRQYATHFSLMIKLHHLGRAQAVDAAVFQHATPHTGIKPDELEARCRIRAANPQSSTTALSAVSRSGLILPLRKFIGKPSAASREQARVSALPLLIFQHREGRLYSQLLQAP